jgi:hypothetical protein
MEVHHQTHKSRKKWTHYFWEFLMLFLAVFCGFLAEYKLEHVIENKRELQYVKSLIEDLKKDTAGIKNYITRREIKQKMMDSLVVLLTTGQYKKMGNETYFFARFISRGSAFISSDGTIQQLKNSGNLRLIRKQALIDSIMAYDKAVTHLKNQDERDSQSQDRFKEIGGEAFRADIFNQMTDSAFNINKPTDNPQLLTNDPVIINKIAFQVQYQAAILINNVPEGKSLSARASRLICVT